MKRNHVDQEGLCRASLCSEAEIRAIQSRIAADATAVERILRWLDALRDPTRFKIVYLLHRYERLCVCDLANVLEVSSSAISQHLRKLRDMALVSTFRRKQTVFYALDDRDFVSFFHQLLPQRAEEERDGRTETAIAS